MKKVGNWFDMWRRTSKPAANLGTRCWECRRSEFKMIGIWNFSASSNELLLLLLLLLPPLLLLVEKTWMYVGFQGFVYCVSDSERWQFVVDWNHLMMRKLRICKQLFNFGGASSSSRGAVLQVTNWQQLRRDVTGQMVNSVASSQVTPKRENRNLCIWDAQGKLVQEQFPHRWVLQKAAKHGTWGHGFRIWQRMDTVQELVNIGMLLKMLWKLNYGFWNISEYSEHFTNFDFWLEGKNKSLSFPRSRQDDLRGLLLDVIRAIIFHYVERSKHQHQHNQSINF